MAKDSNPDLALLIQVESGGCHGFQYLMSLTTLPALESISSTKGEVASDPDTSLRELGSPAQPGLQKKPKTMEINDDYTIFAADDGSGAKVVMDAPSLDLLKGSKVDFTMELIGSQFKIVDNPLATSSCGCGTSFDIKI
jgi:Fe-S cluster assembly iron-binding protein IscA